MNVNEFIKKKVLRLEKNIFIFKLFLVLVGYVGATLWLNAIRQGATIWFVWVLIALQIFLFISIFVVCSMRAKHCGCRYQWPWLFPFLALSRVNNWELVVIPALVLIMLVLSERNQKVSAARQGWLPEKEDETETV